MDKIPVTVVVPVKNEEINLPNCLMQLKVFNQVIVIDSGSTDQTPAIATKFNAEYHNFIWDGKFPKKRNWALRNLDIRNEWVFFLDADEYLTDAFITELAKKIKKPNVNGYLITYQDYFMGKKLKHGDPMRKLPLFRMGKGEYEKIDEDSWSVLDMEIHEHPIIQGEIGKIHQRITHKDYKGLGHYIARHNAYSSWEANRYIQLKSIGFSMLTFRQRLKYRLINTGLLPIVYFIGCFFLKLGILDGKRGYYIAKYKSNYFFQIQTKIIELQRK